VSEVCEVVVTAPDGEWLAGLATELVDRRLAAAGHLSPIRSIYRWDGVQDTGETKLALHTRTALVETVIAVIRERHSFSVPGIWTVPITGSTDDYLRWIGDSTVDPAVS
jgi:periplasmic divalent cation tolerance protein